MIQVVLPEVIHDVKVRPAVVIVVGPVAIKTVAVVVLVKTGSNGYVSESVIAVIAEQEIGRSILRIVVGRRVLILSEALVVAVKTKVHIEPSIAVVVCECGACKCT